MNFLNNVGVRDMIAFGNRSAATSDLNGKTIDLRSHENPASVLAIVEFGTITASAVTSIKWQGSTDNSTWVDLEGTGQTVAPGDDNDYFRNELRPGPDYRYVRAVVLRGTANAAIASAKYLLGELRNSGNEDSGDVNDSHYTAYPQAGTP